MNIKDAQSKGEFKRQEDAFRNWVTVDGSSLYASEKDRYHLYVSLACPWAHRTLIVRTLMGLDHVVGATVVDPVRDDRGWRFGTGDGFTEDPINGFHFLQEAYHISDPNWHGRVTVPVLWDKKTRQIVNNSEDDICLMFHKAFVSFSNHKWDLFPQNVADEQAELSNLIYEKVNNGVYRAGFAGAQAVYERAVRGVFETLDMLENRLADRRYLFGDFITEADLRLFCTLIRFDAVYYVHFKCNMRRIVDYPHLWGYLRDLYQVEGIAETVNLDHIKRHYYITHPDINPTRFVPVGPVDLGFDAPHGRG
ncbi:MAG: glutathione S-transferase family protein [Candidatus Latescibacterota bacterium]